MRVWCLLSWTAMLLVGSACATTPPSAYEDDSPAIVRIPAGDFIAGSDKAETEAAHYPDVSAALEQPARRVTVARAFGIGRTEVTRGEFARFVSATGWTPDGPCSVLVDGPANIWKADIAHDWMNPGFVQTDAHPVVCVNLDDARAYARWLSSRTGRHFRLPSNTEWEYAARAGTTGPLPWPDVTQGTICAYANVSGVERAKAHNGGVVDPARFQTCDDGYVGTSPVASFLPNTWGLYDVIGNVWEWTEDCLNPDQRDAPTDTRARTTGDCASYMDRGASWTNSPKYVRVATQHPDLVDARTSVLGFRLVED